MSQPTTPPRPDNPPAFPWPEAHWGISAHPGMSLRDWFAGMAISGLLAKLHVGPEQLAKAAYRAADAMLQHRQAQP